MESKINEQGTLIYKETKRLIRQAKESGQLVIFVGAGASINAGMPRWSDAVKKIADKLNIGENDKMYDTLKIPQYYYNTYGKKEYTQLMRDIFRYKDILNVQDLHRMILKFQCQTIITTNYDSLIEQAAEEVGEFLQVISCDKDLPYKKQGKELIKMHGDFEHDNFVLREDDYLSYSNNFRLIENYIKSIIGTKVVLFICYSFSDPDVKQIFSWVKDALKDDFQRAYMIVTDKDYKQIESEYYKKIGINVIYASQLINHDSGIGKTEQLEVVLNYILADEKSNALDGLYNDLLPMKDLNYISRDDLRRVLYKYSIATDRERINLSRQYMLEENKLLFDAFWNYMFDTEDRKNNHKIEEILSIIQKNRYAIIQLKKEKSKVKDRNVEVIHLTPYTGCTISSLVEVFDYKGLFELKEELSRKLSTGNSLLYLKYAYLCSFLNDYYTAYNSLKIASKAFYREKMYVWFFISEFNRKNIGNILCGNKSVFSEDVKQIKMEIGSIELDTIIATIPKTKNENYDFLRDIANFKLLYKTFQSTYKQTVEIEREANTRFSYYSGTPAYIRLYENVQEYMRYMDLNYIYLDRYSEMQSIINLYIRSVIQSIAVGDVIDENNPFGNVRKESLTKFDIHVILRYITPPNIKKIFKEYNLNAISVCDEAIDYCREILDNILLSSESIGRETFWRYLVVATFIEKFPSDLTDKLFSELEKTDIVVNRNYSAAIISSFICKVCYTGPFNENTANHVKSMLNNLFDNLNGEPMVTNDYAALMWNLCNLLKKCSGKYSDTHRSMSFFKKETFQLMLECYKYFSLEIKVEIEKYYSKWIDENLLSYEGAKAYCTAISKEVINSDEPTEKRLLEWIANSLSLSERDLLFDADDSYIEILRHMVNNHLNGRFSCIENLKRVVAQTSDKMLQWLVRVEEFNYENFNCEWLSRCSDAFLTDLAQNEAVRTKILESYKKNYETLQFNKKVNDKIITYFLR